MILIYGNHAINSLVERDSSASEFSPKMIFVVIVFYIFRQYGFPFPNEITHFITGKETANLRMEGAENTIR